MPVQESAKDTITTFAGVPKVRVLDDSLSRNMPLPSLADNIGLDTIVISASQMGAVFGSANFIITNGFPSWRLDPTSNELVGGMIQFPDHWNTMKVSLYSVQASGSGPAILYFDYGNVTPGNGGGMGYTSNQKTITYQSFNGVDLTVLEASFNVPTNTHLTQIGVGRLANGAGDTLAADVAIVALVLERLT